MANDSRDSKYTESGIAIFAAADSGSTKDVVPIRDSQTLSPSDYNVSYSNNGTTEATVTLYDEPQGTASGDASDAFDSFHLSPGEKLTEEDLSRDDVSDSVVAHVTGNDDEVIVVVGGHIITG